MVEFSTYKPPGVYVEEEMTALVSVAGVAPTVVAIVGPSVGYRTATEAVTLSDVSAVTLFNKGINLSEDFSVTSLTGVSYGAADYTLTAEAGEDGDILVTGDNTTTIERTSDSAIPSGETVYVAYRYTDSNYFEPMIVSDFDDVEAVYGTAMDLVTNVILSPLSLAAKMAFDNGARNLVLVATAGTADAVTASQLEAGYVRLGALPGANLVVPLPVGITGTEAIPGDVADVGAGLATWLEAQVSLSNLRVGIVGVERSVSIDPANLVASYANKRIMHAHPNRLNFYNGLTNTTIEVSGYYLAAAYAGRFAAQPIQMPLTKKRVRGFAGIPATALSQMTTSKKNTWSDAGVAVAEVTRQNTLVVRHGTSTDRTNVNTREISLVRARDAMVNLIQDTLDASGLIGSYLVAETPTRISGVIEGILETAMASEIIVGYSDVRVRQTSLEPSIIEVKFRYKPAYPLNYIVVSFSVNTETGETTALNIVA